MSREPISPLVVCVLPELGPNSSRTVSYPNYIHEILSHTGICYSAVALELLSVELPHISILITVGEYKLPDDLYAMLRSWVASGGQWIAIGGLCGAADLFGVALDPPAYVGYPAGALNNLGEGYLQRFTTTRLLEHITFPLHFFNGIPVQEAGASVLAQVLDKHQRPTTRVAVTTKPFGKGCSTLIAIDIPGTVVRIQQGISVTRDGVSAPDGSAPICDGILKSADGAVLDWTFDRQSVPDVPGLKAFLEPIADLWRELLLRILFTAMESADVALPLLWLYPCNSPAIAHLSLDTDGNNPTLGQRLLEVVDQAGIASTWCVIAPGYPKDLVSRIGASGHELAMHYDAISSDCPWSQTLFHEQWLTLSTLFSAEPTTNKNHFGRWEGDVEFFRWCKEHGIEMDQSKGGTKTGEAGYNFGTCHPDFPVAFDGEILDVLELPFHTQDLHIFAPPAMFYALLAATLRSHGVLHLIHHPAYIANPGIADSLLAAVAAAQRQGLVWWSATQINSWQRARRKARWQWQPTEDGSTKVILRTPSALNQATILWRCRPDQSITRDYTPQASDIVRRWGFDFWAVQVNLLADTTTQWSCG